MSDIPQLANPAAIEVDHPGRLRANALNLGGAVVIGLGSAAPTVTIALTLAALVAVNSYASPITIFVTGLPMLGIALAYRRLNRWRVNCGATYEWGGKAISPYFGFAIGWITLLAYFLAVISTVLPIGPYALQVVGHGLENSTLGEAVAGTVAIGLVFVAAYVGIKTTARVQWILLAIEYGAVGAIAAISVVAIFGGNPHSVSFQWSWLSPSSLGGGAGFVSGALIAVFGFSGWDTTVLVNEETKDARRTAGNAVVMSVILVGVLECLLTFVFEGAVRPGPLAAHSGNALSYIGQQLSGSTLAQLLILAVLLSALGSTLGSAVSGARIAFAMGSDRVLPGILAHTHPRFKTPSVATIFLCAVALVALWLYALGSSSIQNSFSTIISSDGLLFAVFYAGTGIAMAVYYRRLAVQRIRSFIELTVVPVASAAALLFIAWQAVPSNLGGWWSSDMIYLYVMLGVGVALMLYGRFAEHAPYFSSPREAAESINVTP